MHVYNMTKIIAFGKISMALNLLVDGKATISKAAEIAGIDVWAFIEEIKKSKIIWVKDEIVDKDLEAVISQL